MGQSTDQCPPDVIALIAALLRDELGMPEDPPRVFIYNQNFNLPKATWMFLVVGLLDVDPFGAGQGYAIGADGETLVERSIVSNSWMVTVDALSVSVEARVRLPEITMALTGDASERLMERANLRIFRPSRFVDLSGLEASRRLNRFQTQFAVFSGSGRTKPVPYMQFPAGTNPKLLVQQ